LSADYVVIRSKGTRVTEVKITPQSSELLDVCGVQATLFLRFLFPPPAPFALMLIWKDGAGARLASDGNEAFFVK
jgi:hypothetical protein